MFEKVNPEHPDKVADRIGGAIVDLAYSKQKNPKIAVEVLIGHGVCHVICETSVKDITTRDVMRIVHRISPETGLDLTIVPQDEHLANNQKGKIRCGDNGIFKGVPTTDEQKKLTEIAKDLYERRHGTEFCDTFLNGINNKVNFLFCCFHTKSQTKRTMCDFMRKADGKQYM